MPDYSSKEGPQGQRSTETVQWAGDFTANAGVQVLTSPLASLVRQDTGVSVPASLSGAPTISGEKVLQIVTGLTAGVNYLLTLTATFGGNTESIEQVIRCGS